MKQVAKNEKFELVVKGRDIFGKQLKKLRRGGEVPGNIYGPGFKSTAVSVAVKDFSTIYRKAKETGVVYLQLGKEALPVLIRNVQRHPINNITLHVDFRKIDLAKKIETEVPIVAVGESEAVAQKAGVLLTQSDHLLVEALPTDIPNQIEVDISSLKEIDQSIKVADLPKSPQYEIKDDPEKIIVSVIAHKEESLEPETAPAEAPEVITAKEGEEVPEGEAVPAEGEEPASAKAPAGKEDKEAKAEKPAEKGGESKEPKKE